MSKEDDAYILGTDQAELHRLGLQHAVWAREAHRGFEHAGFTAGQTLLDLGCGPGFCSKELGFVVGAQGKVIGVDRSEHYLAHLDEVARLHGLPIETRRGDFQELPELLSNTRLDGMFCRWALAWVDDPRTILAHVHDALAPGGTLVMQEYFQWGTHQAIPSRGKPADGMARALKACLKSFKAPPGDIDVGRDLPTIVSSLDMDITNVRLMPKMARPSDTAWQWPATFYRVYFPHLVELGYLTQDELTECFDDLERLEADENAILCCPLMIEVVARKR